MCAFGVQIDAAKSNRRLVASAPARRRVRIDPQLLFWRRLIDQAIADAKRVSHGLPTDAAIIARWWIEEHRPPQHQCAEWERSFHCACSWLSLDPDAECKRLIVLIEAALLESYQGFVRANTYLRRAAVLSCAGVPVTIAQQYTLPLVSETDYEHIAGIEHGDPPASRAAA